MTTPRDPDRLIHAFLLEGAEQLQDQVYDVVRAEIDQKRQRVVIGPWRVPTVSKLVPIGLGAAAVIAVLFLGSQFIGSPTSNVGGPASQPPASAAPSEAPVSAAPSAISAPPLTQNFTSTVHGISLSYPEGWTARAATEPWTDSTFPFDFNIPQADFLHRADGFNLNLVFGSQPIGDSTPEEWVAEQMAGSEGCAATEPITVDGATGLIGAGDCQVAVVTTAGRGYLILAGISSDDPSNALTYDRAWFEEVLATVQLRPEDAVDVAPSAAPLTQSFTSQMHGISVSYPEGWTARAATEPWPPHTGGPHYPDPYADVLVDPTQENVYMFLGSQPIGDSTPDEWIAERVAADSDCSATQPIAVDGATGLIGADCNYIWVTTAGRGYRIRLYTSGDYPPAGATYNREWFEGVLATVQLHPEDAVDVAPSATP